MSWLWGSVKMKPAVAEKVHVESGTCPPDPSFEFTLHLLVDCWWPKVGALSLLDSLRGRHWPRGWARLSFSFRKPRFSWGSWMEDFDFSSFLNTIKYMLQYIPERYSKILWQRHLKTVFISMKPTWKYTPAKRCWQVLLWVASWFSGLNGRALTLCSMSGPGWVSGLGWRARYQHRFSVSPPRSMCAQGRVVRVRQQHPADQPGGRASPLPLAQTYQRGPGAGAQRGRGGPRGAAPPAHSLQTPACLPPDSTPCPRAPGRGGPRGAAPPAHPYSTPCLWAPGVVSVKAVWRKRAQSAS